AAQPPMTPLPLPSEAPAAPTSVTDRVSPKHASGIAPTSTRATLPALSTVRVAESDDTPQEVVLALPAESAVAPEARVAAAAQPANVTATARLSPRGLERR